MASAPPGIERAVFFFDIDNCLYPKSSNVHREMVHLINRYSVKHLEISTEEATRLHLQYYKDYGLAIEGLTRHHNIDALEYNREVDDALPLERLLKPDPEIRRIIESFDKTKVKLWLFTNAHVTHGERVVNLLQLADLFEGITFCDYRQSPLVPKPKPEMFAKAENEAGVTDSTRIYYVDDSGLNCEAAYARGWTDTVHLVEPQDPNPTVKVCRYQIAHLRELLGIFPELLRPETS